MSSLSLTSSSERAAPNEWAEFLLVGGGTLLLFPAVWLLKQAVGENSAEFAVGFLMFHAAFVINDPHFAVTYLLFYRDVRARALGPAFGPAQRARYWLAGFVVPVALAVWTITALVTNSAPVLGAMIQLMFLLVGWHYAKQGFGVLSVLSARRGVTFSRWERSAFLAHCFSGWAYARASPRDPGTESMEKGVLYTSFPHPPGLEALTLVLFITSSVALLLTVFIKWRREGRFPPLVPLAGLLITVWLWMVFSSIEPLLVYAIPALHSVQYLYFVWLLKRNQATAQASELSFRSVRSQLLRVLLIAIGLGWLLFHGLPTFLDETIGLGYDSEGGLGATPYFAALFTFVNLHHYFMDFVIWRRDNAEMRYLLQRPGEPVDNSLSGWQSRSTSSGQWRVSSTRPRRKSNS